MIRRFNQALVASLICLLSAGSFAIYAQNDIQGDIDKLEKFLKNLDQNYVDEVETKQIVEAGMRRMLEELDPHSVYLDKGAYERATEPLKGKFKGIGVRFLMINDTMTILELIDGGAAEKAGIRRGDQIVAIEGDTVSGVDLSARTVSRKIKASENDAMEFDIVRPYPDPRSISFIIERSEVEVSSVPASFMFDQRTGYIKLERFSASSLSDFRNALDELKREKVKNLILDLRGNGGGYLNVAIKIADEFLEDRKLIVYTQGLHQDKRETFASSGGRYTDGALYLLIDENSASASEILAGAIQDLDRGLIIGRRSYGKGLVQRTIEFSDGSAMRLTISRYYTPTGRSIQRPYEDGVALYRDEIKQRRLSGELLSADSIHIADSLIYLTPSKRKVYGGGGIIPDVFVPLDTTSYPSIVLDLRNKGLFDGIALRYADKEGEVMRAEMKTVRAFIQDHHLEQSDLAIISHYAAKRGVDLDPEALEENRELIERFVKVPLARYIYGREAYYEAMTAYDDDVKMALTEIEVGTVKELGLR
ncbi:MAG: S41 family peptidase [Cryomorphaceae bacterium]